MGRFYQKESIKKMYRCFKCEHGTVYIYNGEPKEIRIGCGVRNEQNVVENYRRNKHKSGKFKPLVKIQVTPDEFDRIDKHCMDFLRKKFICERCNEIIDFNDQNVFEHGNRMKHEKCQWKDEELIDSFRD